MQGFRLHTQVMDVDTVGDMLDPAACNKWLLTGNNVLI